MGFGQGTTRLFLITVTITIKVDTVNEKYEIDQDWININTNIKFCV